ncbi:MAG: cobyrinate a,c-diamide synthase [Chloroflexi bacterium]|nr:cobyrinate a,c-diamide synthase [Chloroflexota bacterium]
MNIPRLVLAAPASGSGKTTLAAGLIAAFRARGVRVAPFKVGPDYIDPTYHALAAARPCRNLDAWMLSPGRVSALFAHAAAGADLALVEGVMGLFDGLSGRDDTASTAHVARILDAPVLLVLDASAMARTAAAVVRGMRDFDPRVHLAGVLLNRVAGRPHANMVREAIESELRLPVVGYLERDPALDLPERHLGLIPTLEPGRWAAWLDRARAQVEATVDLDQVLAIARAASTLSPVQDDPFALQPEARAVIAVARDAAFNFLYQDNLDLLRAAGAEIVFFSPMQDHALPSGTQGIYLCGGFPEVHAAALAANSTMREEIRAGARARLPIYAECGGLMYLTEEIVDMQNVSHPMVGVLPGRSALAGQLALGYRTATAAQESWLWRKGETVRGHEFHYSTWQGRPASMPPAYELRRDDKDDAEQFVGAARFDGAVVDNVFASYLHLHFIAQPAIAQRFVSAAAQASPAASKGRG